MSLREIDVVLTTNEAINFLKISKPTFLKLFFYSCVGVVFCKFL
jgi:hypothetical protein